MITSNNEKSMSIGKAATFAALAVVSAALPLHAEAAIQFGGVTSLGFHCDTPTNCDFDTNTVDPLTAPAITASNAVLLIGLSLNGSLPIDLPTSITYNGVSLGSPTSDSGTVNFTRTAVWVVTNPASAKDIVMDFDWGAIGVVTATYYTGVHPLSPYRTATVGTGLSNPASLSVTNSQSGDLIVGFFGLNDTSAANGYTQARMGAGQTFRDQTSNLSEESQLSLSDEAGASGSVTHSWDFVNDGGNGWSGVALPLIPAPGVIQKPPNNLGLVGYWSFDEGAGTVAGDFSGNRYHGTLSGDDGLPTWTNGKRGKALDFAFNSDDHVALGNTLDIASLPFTASAWIRLDPAGDGSHRAIINKRDTFANDDMRFQVHISPGNSIGLDHPTGAVFFNYTIPLSTWVHLTTVASSTGSALYVNGVFEEQGGVYTLGTDATAQVYIGSNPDFDDFEGDMDELRLYNRALGATEIAALYGQGTGSSGAVQIGTPTQTLHEGTSLGNGLVGHWTFDGSDFTNRVYDRSGQGNNGYVASDLAVRATSSLKMSGKLGQAAAFNAASQDFIFIPSSSSILDLETALTVSAWVKTRTESGDDGIFSRGDPGDDRWYFYLDDGALVLGSLNNAGNFTFAVENGPISHVGEWVHLVGVMDSTLSGSDRIRLYRDGIELTDKTFQWTNGFDSSNTFTDIGALVAGTGFYFDGAIDDVRIYNRPLTTTEIKQLYRLGGATVRP
jgi:hypothetical protein